MEQEVGTGPPLVQEAVEVTFPNAQRDRLSANFYRFLDRWGDRPDLLLHPDPDR